MQRIANNTHEKYALLEVEEIPLCQIAFCEIHRIAETKRNWTFIFHHSGSLQRLKKVTEVESALLRNYGNPSRRLLEWPWILHWQRAEAALYFVAIPLAIRRTLMTRIIVGLIGSSRASNSSKMMPAIESTTINISSWFHLLISELNTFTNNSKSSYLMLRQATL